MTGAVSDPDADAGTDPRAILASLFRGQAGWCQRLGSPIYSYLLERAAEDLETGGPVWRAVEPYLDRPYTFTPPRRLLGATHRLALPARRRRSPPTTRRLAAM